MNNYIINDSAYVTADGSWSQDSTILTFPASALNDPQWQTLDELPDSQKLLYVEAILNGLDVSEWEL